MKVRIICLGIIMMVCLGLVPQTTQGQTTERITDFSAGITVAASGIVDIQENINYDFGLTSHHGIYRYIPYRYTRSGATYNIRLAVSSITMDSGQNVPYTTTHENGNIVLKIGDADKTVDGIHEYSIRYTVQRAINFFDDHDELFWNVTGNGWEVPIEKATVTVIGPSAFSLEALQPACYTGAYGSTEQACTVEPYENNGITVIGDTALAAGEGLTFAVAWPAGTIQKPTATQNIRWFISDNWPIALPFIVLIVMFYLWYTRGRDPKGKGTIIPIYEPPQSMTSIEMGTVLDEKLDPKDISSAIIQLAVRGYLKIREIEQKKLLGKSTDYELVKLKEADENLKDYEQTVLNGLFESGSPSTVSGLKNKFYKKLKDIRKQVYEAVVTDGYFPMNPDKVRNSYSTGGAVILFMVVIFGGVFKNGLAIAAFIVSGVAILLMSRAMPRRSKLGVTALEEIKGFKWFLSVTETERLKFHNAPAKSPQQFEQFLPYAMVLGVEKEWAKQFEGMYVTPPEW
ncbi:MAG: DUF2207 domain-containing protein, partial [Patescibacteria group bacterium]